MNNTKSFDTYPQTCYYSTLLLLNARDQAPPHFWDQTEVLEAPSSRDPLTQQKTFASCGDLQVALDKESQALRQRKRQHEQEKHQRDELYDRLLSVAMEGLEEVQSELRVAARLHNYILQHQDRLQLDVDGKGGREGLEPVFIGSGNLNCGVSAGRVVIPAVLREELEAALVGVRPYHYNRVTAGTLPSGSSLDVTVAAKPKLDFIPMLSRPIAPVKKYSALMAENFMKRKSNGSWSDRVAAQKQPITDVREILRSYLPDEPYDTASLTISQELALAVVKQLGWDDNLLGGLGEKEGAECVEMGTGTSPSKMEHFRVP